MAAVGENKAVCFYVRNNGEAAIVCPECNLAKIVSVHKFKKRLYKLRVRCTCSHKFLAKLDYRQNYRKNVNLVGTITDLTDTTEEVVQIINVSMGGICFKVTGRHDFEIGLQGKIHFFLDDKRKTEMNKRIRIKSIIDQRICCEFIHDLAFERDLGFYLRT